MTCTGYCTDCKEWRPGQLYEDGNVYCDTCWEYYELKNTRCFSFAAIYDSSTGDLLTVASSHIGTGCAERRAMWRLKEQDISSAKSIVVCRIRRNRNNRTMTFGMSKPCAQCICAMHIYNITEVSYSEIGNSFTAFIQLHELHNTYSTASKVVVSIE